MGSRAAAQDPTEALQATAAGVYDTMIKVAARLSRVQERLAEAKEAFLADRAAVSSACPHMAWRHAWPLHEVVCAAWR